ncbi:hypothetical protein UFOVP529_112 [uncultured Caudovirales phage]|uniref:Uncharacterized protein n=1 Tax=uncultured Caudovirales phage TaxID=2100421 RepID=A0A6J5MR89_9CAUD|nr:hypothetical protein UFOVP529_112 [uncultured Caudovirales phage]CAB4190312.1 hypothetical protein UFOVP1191_50 [uncultured Caudovirales phage]CAB4194308.1 hypothetical protein UFOVP1252_9 [uncultured Caudovirales phage]
MARYAFTDENNICKQIIFGDLSEEQLAVFDADYAILFQSTSRHEIGTEDPVQIGWVLVDGVFTEPV